MKVTLAYMKKELTEQIRSGRLALLGIIFLAIGIMNPAVAKLTPQLFEMLSDSLAESGMTVTEITVTAKDSIVQLYKNMPLALIAFALMEGGIFTREYESGTMALTLCRGISRHKVLLSKLSMLLLLWGAGYWLSFLVTYGYTAYYWDLSAVPKLWVSALLYFLFGIFTVSLAVFFSSFMSSGAGVLGVGFGTVVAMYLVGIIPKVGKYLPTKLIDGSLSLTADTPFSDYIPALVITLSLCAVLCAVSFALFSKRSL